MTKLDLKTIKKIILIRRDNIGDLVCTTPTIHALRKKFPGARISVLVNSYNADVVLNNPDIDEIYIYEKAKHIEDRNRLLVWLKNIKLLLRIRRERYDVAIGCSYKYSSSLGRYTLLTGAKNRIGYAASSVRNVYYNVPLNEPSIPIHEVSAVFKLLEPLGITGEPSNLVLIPSADEKEKILNLLFQPSTSRFPLPNLIAMHISSRKESNRWPAERFIEFGNELNKKYNIKLLILWSPGSNENLRHPGDDEKAAEIAKGINLSPILYKTTSLKELIAAISICKLVVCCDGGAMHIAAALGKPLLTIWGSTDKRRWSPWKTECIILQNGLRADEISVQEVVDAFGKLYRQQRS